MCLKIQNREMATNAFCLNWNGNYFYIFPPLCLVGHVLAKIYRGKTNAVIVAPDWSNQY